MRKHILYDGPQPEFYTDFLMMRDVYKCTWTEYIKQPAFVVEMHKAIHNIEADANNKKAYLAKFYAS